jgi:CRISPR/Cas system CMR subunit Cmr4 (Cas7 group RAMP superfamily)
MKDEIKGMLDREIQSQLQELSLCDPGDEDYKAKADAIEQLYKLRLEEKKLVEARSDRKGKVVGEAIGVALPVACYVVGMVLGFRFEEKGSISSLTFRNVLSWFKPRVR